MHKRIDAGPVIVRLMSAEQAAAYCGVGKTFFRQWAIEIGAVRKLGKRVLYDRQAIDAAIDEMAPAEND